MLWQTPHLGTLPKARLVYAVGGGAVVGAAVGEVSEVGEVSAGPQGSNALLAKLVWWCRGLARRSGPGAGWR